MIDDKVVIALFSIFYGDPAQRGKGSPSFLSILLFEIILNAEDQNNEFDKPDKNHLIRFNRIVKAFRLRPNLETSRPVKCLHTFFLDLGS